MALGHWCPILTVAALGSVAIVRLENPSKECDCDAQDPSPAANVAQPVVHDPTIAKDGKLYALFATGRGISMRLSHDRKNWESERQVFSVPPPWAKEAIVGFRDHIWAPDVSKFGGRWHLYYSISTFGKNRSAIGHATNVTLDPADPRYRWEDHGPVVQSYPTDDFNAIDPNAVLDAKGHAWLSFGSFWNGLRIVPLDASGGPVANAKPIPIAARPHEGPQQPGAIEAPFIFRHGGYYYLFASYDFCCRGANSTYNVRVGRSKAVTGPYLDREGKGLIEGGGSKVVESGVRWKGTGHEAVLHDGRVDVLIYHAYDAEDRGTPKLQQAKIVWDQDGWPTVPPSE